MNSQAFHALSRCRRSALGLALMLAGSGLALAQSTTGSIFGTAPAAPGETVQIRNTTSGLLREVPVDAQGRFSATALPIGNYTVSLQRDGQTLDARRDVELRVGTSTQVSFAATGAGSDNAKNLTAVTVNASALPTIDVTSVDSRTVITAGELAKLPIARNAEAVAMLAPGVVAGSPAFGSAVSFSGSSVSENAYYINGFDTSNPLTNIGGMQLPYDAIEQQEVLSGGYGAQYGRSDGGVISQVGKRGSNEWHFGAHASWTPRSLHADTANTYYVSGGKAGKLYGRYAHNSSWDTDVSGYIGGPLIKDKLFLYTAYEAERQQGSSIGSIDSPYKTQYAYKMPRWYTKVDWNINDSNILEFTAASSKTAYESTQYNYDYATDTEGSFRALGSPTKNSSKMGVLKYTGYLTDNLTLTALYGKMRQENYTDYPGYDPARTYISGITSENPAIVGGSPIKSPQPFGYINAPGAANHTTNLRIDLAWHLGDHTLSAGIDNQVARAIDQGSLTSGPGYWWIYKNASNDPGAPIDPAHGVPAPVGYPGGETGYYVSQYSYNAMASARTVQRAQYVEDAWQVNDRLLLKLGLRNDTFTNYNVNSEPYVRQTKPQWAPRLGFAWDVDGDASFKVFGNVGRYYLALPNQVAIRAAGGSLYTNHYYTYTGINADGTPSGLTELPPYHPVSPDGELGVAPDPTTVASQNLKSEYQDEYILGFEKQLNPAWVYGVKGTVRNLRSAIDDVCDTDVILATAAAQGIDTSTLAPLKGCRIFNPGVANNYVLLTHAGTHETVRVSNADYGFPQLKRKYYGLEFKLEHPFDGKWYGSFNYVYSRSYGNTEGQVRTDVSQSDISATTSWDDPALMVNSNGDQASDRRHQFKFNGYYQLAPEWLVGANLAVSSGAPKSCLGSYGYDDSNPDPISYGYSAYYFCNHQAEPPGRAGRLPWQWQLSANVEYRPEWAGRKLAFNLYVFNLLNQQRPTLLSYGWGSTGAVPTDSYDRVVYRQAPRYVRMAVSYDF